MRAPCQVGWISRAVLLAVAVLFARGFVLAGEARDYAYLFVQGRLAGATRGEPAEGVRIRLTSGDRSFEAKTNARGVFEFEKLPVATYDMEAWTSEGRTVIAVRRLAKGRPGGTDLELTVGGTGSVDAGKIRLAVTEGRVAVEVPQRSTDWRRLGIQGGIFVGAAAVLVLLL